MDIPSFLRRYPPFDDEDEDGLADVVRHTKIAFYPSGALILHQSGEPAHHLYVVRTGVVELIDEGQVADVLHEGEVFGFVSLFTGLGPAFDIRAAEDSICYLVDGDVAQRLMGTRRGLSFLARSLRRREITALGGVRREEVDPWPVPVGTLVRRPPVFAVAGSTIRQASELMTTERISSVLLDEGERLGIVTDRDLRSRVLALGRDPDDAVTEIMTSPVITAVQETSVGEVMSIMLEHGVHHVPVVDRRGSVIGVVTDTDLMGFEQKTPFALRVDVERAKTREHAIAAAKRLPEMVATVVEANVEPLDVAHAIGVTSDALTNRLIDLAIRKEGEPPCAWSWLALGSLARHEQALSSDQDNAIAYDAAGSDVEKVDAYFERVARFVNDGLEEAGFARCKAGVVASSRSWRGTVSEWTSRFERWMAQGGSEGVAFADIAFDYRPVAGPLDVRPALDALIREAHTRVDFLHRLARLAVMTNPPIGVLKGGSAHRRDRRVEELDVKHGAITLITNLARAWSIRCGVTENRTLRRLSAVAHLDRIDQETAAGLEEAFRLVWQVRMESQVHHVRSREAVDDLVNPALLGPLTRQGLREAFRVIERAQTELALGFGIRR